MLWGTGLGINLHVGFVIGFRVIVATTNVNQDSQFIFYSMSAPS